MTQTTHPLARRIAAGVGISLFSTLALAAFMVPGGALEGRAQAAGRLPGAALPAPEYPAGLAAGFCVEIGTNSWGPFRTRTDAEAYAGRLPSARAAGLTWCPIRP